MTHINSSPLQVLEPHLTSLTPKSWAVQALPHMSLIFIGLICVGLTACAPDLEALYNQGISEVEQKRYQSAIAIFEQLEQAAEGDVKYRYKSQYGKTIVYLKSERLDRQADVLNYLLSHDEFKLYHATVREDLEENLLTRAQVERGKADNSGAIKLYKRALELNPKSDARAQMTRYLRADAQALLRERRFDEALTIYRELLKLNDGDESLTQRLEAQVKATEFRLYRVDARRRFLKHRAELLKSKLYDDKTKTFYFKVQSYVEGRVTSRNSADLEREAKTSAQQLALVEVSDYIQKWFDLKREPEVNLAFISFIKGEFERRARRIKVNGRRARVTMYSYHFTLPLESAYQIAFEAHRLDHASSQAPAQAPAQAPTQASTPKEATPAQK